MLSKVKYWVIDARSRKSSTVCWTSLIIHSFSCWPEMVSTLSETQTGNLQNKKPCCPLYLAFYCNIKCWFHSRLGIMIDHASTRRQRETVYSHVTDDTERVQARFMGAYEWCLLFHLFGENKTKCCRSKSNQILVLSHSGEWDYKEHCVVSITSDSWRVGVYRQDSGQSLWPFGAPFYFYLDKNLCDSRSLWVSDHLPERLERRTSTAGPPGIHMKWICISVSVTCCNLTQKATTN